MTLYNKNTEVRNPTTDICMETDRARQTQRPEIDIRPQRKLQKPDIKMLPKKSRRTQKRRAET